MLQGVIINPLDMQETKIALDEVTKANLVAGRDEFGRVAKNWDLSVLEGAGGIKSSTSDMVKYLRAQIGIDKTPIENALKITHQKRHDKYPTRDANTVISMGLGWIISAKNNNDIYWHSGGLV